MSDNFCIGNVCFVPLDPNSPQLFTFSNFLAGYALVVLAWTIADTRYRFRVATAPIPLTSITFFVVVVVGTLALLTDLWRSQGWVVPKGSLLTPAGWQAILAGSFLMTSLSWAWFAFIRPPRYGTVNARRYAAALYDAILRSNTSDLAVIADELGRSAAPLIQHATDHRDTQLRPVGGGNADDQARYNPTRVTAYADSILLLIADRRFCRAIVDGVTNGCPSGSSRHHLRIRTWVTASNHRRITAPHTRTFNHGAALAIFENVARTKKYGVSVKAFGRNVVSEAILNENSFLYHEADGYDTGLLGYHKPVSQAMFSSHAMAAAVGTLLDPDFRERERWVSSQWNAYCRAILMTLRDYADKAVRSRSSVFSTAFSNIEDSVRDLYQLDGMTDKAWNQDVTQRLRVAVDFIEEAAKLFDESGVAAGRPSPKWGQRKRLTIFDDVAYLIFEVVFSAASVRSPRDLCWTIQHNMVWGELFNFGHLDGSASRGVKCRVRRLIYDEVSRMTNFPNFKGAKILGFCLNVMGLAVKEDRYTRDSVALQKALLSWTRKHWVWLHSYNERVAAATLVDGMSYDPEKYRLVRTYPAQGLRREPHHVYLNLDHP